MTRSELNISIPDGYQILTRQETLDILDAGILLHSRKRRRYTSAHRQDEMATLVRHVVKCPFCGHELPAYGHFLNTNTAPRQFHVSRNVIDAWANPQYSFFGREDDTLELNTVVLPGSRYTCRKCGNISPPGKGIRSVTLRTGEKKVAVSCRLTQTRYLLDLMKRRGQGRVRLLFPLTETVVFHLGNGRSYLKITGSDGSDAAVFDITYEKRNWLNSEIYAMIRDYPLLRRKLRQCFAKIYGCDLPFPAEELTPDAFVAMTQFVGYPREFYDAVPYQLGSGNLARSFVGISRRLQNSRNLERIYNASGLPQMKSIRRLFFSEPGWFFYLRDAEALWNVFEDPNHYRRLLNLPRIYELLSYLHQYPGICIFLQDYKAVKGAACLLKKLAGEPEITLEYAVNYWAMRDSMRKAERDTWQEKQVSVRQKLKHSIPVQTLCRRIPDTSVDGYNFSWLKTYSAYVQAGRALKNCLVEWNQNNNPVVIVKKGSQLKGAIEVDGDLVVQARAAQNAPIEEDENLAAAIEKWKAVNNLKNAPFFDGEDEDEDGLWF